MIRAGLLRLGGSVLEQLLAADRGHRGPSVPCGRGHEAVFVSYRDKVIDTVLGPVTVTRAWYHCAACGHGLAPRDAELGVAGASLSPGLAAMNDRAAAAVPFARAAAAAGGTGRGPADRQARRAGGRGQRRRRRRRRPRTAPGSSPPGSWSRCRPSPLPDKLYAVIDGTGVPMTSRETAGPGGQGRGRPRPHPRGQARRLLHPGQAGQGRLPGPRPGLLQRHRHLRARRRRSATW